MNNHRGQASILIAIIFQILFVFFAMVVNVGLLVHDKINLQNSVDIAAYYGAMKQAEVLNAMAQVNYEIRQSWKLFAWRLWVLGDAGRNTDFMTGMQTVPTDVAATWGVQGNADPFVGPIVCVGNGLWKNNLKSQNLCHSSLSINDIPPLQLKQAQSIFSSFFNVFVNQTQANHVAFMQNFSSVALTDYTVAAEIIRSYKIAVANRRLAMHRLQGLLIGGPQDFNDLSGSSVAATVQNTLNKNLTAGNKALGIKFSFANSLGGNPFIVPIDVRSFITYLDFPLKGSTQTGKPKEMNMPSVQDVDLSLFNEAHPFWAADYEAPKNAESAASFNEEPEDLISNQKAYYSLTGFEKNPWVMAYVSVTASTTPKMLFSPVTQSAGPITLTAEAYAMPFGGKLGPWYYDSWPQGAEQSTGQNQIDPLLPPRMDSDVSNVTKFPNYSRYPGDDIGMRSQLARYIGIKTLGANNQPKWSDYSEVGNVNSDPVVYLADAQSQPVTRNLEIAAISPDLFDAAYYSVNYEWTNRLSENTTNLFQNICKGGCYNLGSSLTPTPANTDVTYQAQVHDTLFPEAVWAIPAAQIQTVNTSWSQGNPGEYDGAQAAISAGQTWENSSGDKPAGGRVGYSVKLVSKKFLQGSMPIGGATNGSGVISNPPQ